MHTPTTNYRIRPTQYGFTVIELLVVIVILVFLGALITLTYSGVRAQNRNDTRQKAINKLQIQLETYYAQTDRYPTLANLNDPAWRATNLKNLPANALQDPHWIKTTSACTADGRVIAASAPAAGCYSYQVTGSDGSACDNAAAACAHYTLAATLEGGGTYTKSSLN